MIDLNDFLPKAHALMALAHTYGIARMDYDGEAQTIARILESLGYMRWEGYNLTANIARYSLTLEGRAWLEAQHEPEATT